MDIEYIKNKIYHLEDQKKIQPGEYLSKEIINILKDGMRVDQTDCFAKAESGCLYESEIACSRCGKEMNKKINKTTILSYLNNQCDILCDICLELKEKEQELKRKETEMKIQQIKQNKINATEEYVEQYLDPNKPFNKNMSIAQIKEIIVNGKNKNNSEIANYIKNMSYSDFLKTPYWKAISLYKKYTSNYKCSICGCVNNLSTHHSTYKNHGREHLLSVIDSDLIVLCQDCHNKFHDKLPTPS